MDQTLWPLQEPWIEAPCDADPWRGNSPIIREDDAQLHRDEDHEPSLHAAYDEILASATTGANSLARSIISMPISSVLDTSDLDFYTIRILLDRYQHTLIPCFLPLKKSEPSPWEILHIPKVHQILGEIMVQGDAGNSRVSLFFAVLCAGAFHLDVQARISGATNSQWPSLGELFRRRAKTRLRLSLKDLWSGRSKEDITDVMLALTSMFTVRVVSGEMTDISIYLRQISLLKAVYWTKLSTVPASLVMVENIFLYIETLQDTVGIFGRRRVLEQQLPEHTRRTVMPAQVDPNASHENNGLQNQPEAMRHSDSLESPPSVPGSPAQDNRELIFEQIFSIPASLFQLISRTSALVHELQELEVDLVPRAHACAHEQIVRKISQLEKEIWDWKKPPSSEQNYTDNDQVFGVLVNTVDATAALTTRESSPLSPLHHFMDAMHSALLIHSTGAYEGWIL
ncbi:Fungal specific transcription factor domain-containing protein isoform 2 [Cladophialophora immunda]|nr:Fungal specific transcription factor domain-containing protein isoform 1 [Cladophialophora immunda]OQV02326.1 Fungal specific transcription factor domain-containing protein isoform 2 [Cladophialophora immunda]